MVGQPPRRDGLLAVVAGLVAGIPFPVAAFDEMRDEGPDGPYSNDAYGALLDWSALVLLLPFPFVLASRAARPLHAAMLAGLVASVGVFVFMFTVGRVTGPAEVAFSPLVIFPPVGFGVLAGTWALLARKEPVPRWAWAACIAALGAVAAGFLASFSEGAYSIGGLPPFQLGWIALAIAALVTAVLAWRRREPRAARPTPAETPA